MRLLESFFHASIQVVAILAMSSFVFNLGFRSHSTVTDLQLSGSSLRPYTSVRMPAMWKVCRYTFEGGVSGTDGVDSSIFK